MRKTNIMYEKVAAMLLAVVLLTISFCCTAMAENTNLLADLDPSFEGAETPKAVTLGGNAAVITMVAHEGTKSVSLAHKDDYVQFRFRAIEPNTNYTFSFWMQNSVAGSLGLRAASNRFTVGSDTMANQKDTYNWDWYYSGRVALAGATFGAERTEEADIQVWRKVAVNFTSPYEDVEGINLTLHCEADDSWLVVDDFCLVRTGEAANMIANGSLEALDTASAAIKPSNISATNLIFGTTAFVEEDENTGKHYVKIQGGTSTTAESFLSGAFYMKGKSLGKRYKISFKYKGNENTKPRLRLYGNNKVSGTEYHFIDYLEAFPKSTGEWETYSVYIDATDFLNAGLGVSKTIRFGRVKNNTWYLDDLYACMDTNNIGFYKDLTFSVIADTGARHYSGDKMTDIVLGTVDETTRVNYFEEAVTYEKSTEAASLAELTAVDGYKTVTARAHFLPVENEDGTFDEQTVTLFTGVYKYENNMKTLVDLNVATDTSTDGKVIDAVGTVRVPENTDTATYKVEAVAFDLENSGLKPLMDKAVIQ